MRSKVKIFLILSGIILLAYVAYVFFSDSDNFSRAYQDRHQILISKVPDSIKFAGEKVHFKTIDAYRHFYRELKLNTKNNSSTRLLMKDASIWLPQMEAIIKRYNLPTDIKYIAMAESGFQNATSHRSAVGFWQFKEGTAREMGLRVDEEVDERLDPILSTHAACKYFKRNYKVLKSWTLVAAAYNRGLNGLLKDMKRQKAKSYYDMTFSLETERYLYRVISLKDLYEHPSKYRLKWYRHRRVYYNYVTVSSTIVDLSSFALQHKISIEKLKELNPWLRSNALTVPENRNYKVAISQK